MNPRVRQLIIQSAQRHGLDPEVALRIASAEGGIRFGAVGDGGHAFGPFQMNDAGGVLTGRKGNHGTYANSPAGIDEAVGGIARYAAGLHGRSGVAAGVRGYERPAAPGAEIDRAMGFPLGGGSTPTLMGASPQQGSQGLLGSSGGDIRTQVALSLLQAAGNQGQFSPGSILGLAAQRKQSQAADQVFGPAASRQQGSPGGASSSGGINELFYDPLGGIKNDKQIGAIGGHSDHVHLALTTEQAQRSAIGQAQRMGMRVGQDTNQNVTNVHATDSYHYKNYNKNSNLRMAADISGTPQQMAAFYTWVSKTF